MEGGDSVCNIWLLGTLGCDAGCSTSGVRVGCMIVTLGFVDRSNVSGARRVGAGLQRVVLLKSVAR